MKNTMEHIKKAKGRINPYYDLTIQDAKAILENNANYFDIVCDGFVFGYIQGAKAQKKGKAYIK